MVESDKADMEWARASSSEDAFPVVYCEWPLEAAKIVDAGRERDFWDKLAKGCERE